MHGERPPHSTSSDSHNTYPCSTSEKQSSTENKTQLTCGTKRIWEAQRDNTPYMVRLVEFKIVRPVSVSESVCAGKKGGKGRAFAEK